MKKIVSLLLVTIMMVSFSAVSFAASLECPNVTADQKTVALNATGDDAKVVITHTIDFGSAQDIMGMTAELVYDKTALTLDGYSLSGGITWAEDYKNLNADYGAYFYFTDGEYTGISANQLVLTTTFIVNNTSAATSYDVAIRNLQVTDVYFSTYEDYTVAQAGKITVKGDDPVTPPAPTTVEKAVQATVTSYNEKMTGVLFTAVDGSNKGQYVVRFNGAVEAGNVKVGLKVTGVPATNNLTITAENYYGTANTGVLK